MTFQPLTQEQFQSAKSAGFTPGKILEMEKIRKSKSAEPTINQPTPEPKRSVFGKIANFLAPSITRTVEKAIDPNQDVTGRDIFGSALEAASYALPVGAIGRGLSLGLKAAKPLAGAFAKPLARKALEFGTVGAGAGALQQAGGAIGEGAGAVETFQRAGGGAIAGAIGGVALPVAGRVIGKAVTGLAKRTPTTRLQEMTRNLRTLQNTYDEGIKRTKIDGKWVEKSNPIKTLGERKLVPNVVDAKVDATNIIDTLRGELETLASPRSASLAKSRKTVAFNDFKRDVVRTIQSSKELKNSGMVGTTMKKAESVLGDFRTTFGKRMTLETLDNIRMTMNKRYDPDLKDVFRSIGDAARKHVYILDKESSGILNKEGEILAAIRFAEALQGRAVKGGRLGGYVSSVLGAMVGASTQIPVAGPIIGAMGARSLDRAIRNLYFKTPGAKTAQKIISGSERLAENARSVFGKPKAPPLPKGSGTTAIPKTAAIDHPEIGNYEKNVPRGGIEPPTQGSSNLRSTTELPRLNSNIPYPKIISKRSAFGKPKP